MNPSDVRFEVVVPKDRVFVMGDHRSVSADSRCHLSDLSTSEPQGEVAFVPISMVVGPAVAVAAPFNSDDASAPTRHLRRHTGGQESSPTEAVIKPEGVSC